MKIHARCCCGAEITIDACDHWEAVDAKMIEKEWREAHKDCKSNLPAGTIIKRDTKTTGGE